MLPRAGVRTYKTTNYKTSFAVVDTVRVKAMSLSGVQRRTKLEYAKLEQKRSNLSRV